MERLIGISDFLNRLVTRVGKVAAWAAIGLIVVIIFDVVTRRFLVLGSTKLQELEWHIHTVLFTLCLGYAYTSDAHVRIDLVREKLSQRTKWWIELFGVTFALIPYCVIVLYFSVGWVAKSWVIGEISDSATGLPYRWLVKSAIPLGFSFLLLSGVAVLLRNIVGLFGPPELRDRVIGTGTGETEHPGAVKVE